MAARPTSTKRGMLSFAAGAVMALAALAAGCQSRSAYLLAYQEHSHELAAWCYSYLGVRASSEAGQDCIRRAWPNVPNGECFNRDCINGLVPFYRTYHHDRHYDAGRGPIAK